MLNATPEALTPAVLGVLILDSEGNRIVAKYYKDFLSTPVEQVRTSE